MLSARFKPWHVAAVSRKVRLAHGAPPAGARPLRGDAALQRALRILRLLEDRTRRARASELKSYADAARFFNPMLVTFTGGEPTLRRDLEDARRRVDRAITLKYVTLITHGAMLTPERAQSLWHAGVHQFNISLDYLDERHDARAAFPGSSAKILAAIPAMRARGSRQHPLQYRDQERQSRSDPADRCAARRELGVGVNFSVYTDAKNGNRDFLDRTRRAARTLDDVIAELLAFKRRRRGVITNSDYYLEQIPRYVRGEMTEPCRSGIRTIHIDPTGHVKRCPDFPTDFHWRDFKQYEPIDCNACYYACRGEAQAPLRLSRIRDVMA